MIGLQDETNRCSTKVLHVHILSSPIPRKMLHKICRICKIYWCKWDETSSSIPSWTLRSKVFGAMTKEHLVSEGVLPMSTLEVPTSGVDGLTYPWKPFLWHSPTVPASFFLDRTNRWQAPFVAEVKAVGLGCGLWTALCLGDFESLTFTPGKGRGRGAKGGRGKGGSCRMNFQWLSWENGILHCARPWGRGWHSCRTCWCYLGSLVCSLWLMPQLQRCSVWIGPTKLNSFPSQKLTGRRWLTKEGAPGVVHWNEKQAGMASHVSSWR